MTFLEYYQSLKRLERPMHPAKAFIMNIATITGKNPKTITQWVSGVQHPPLRECEKISAALGLNVSELFPDCNNR